MHGDGLQHSQGGNTLTAQIVTSTTDTLIPITEHHGAAAVNLRDLHAFLEVKKDFTNWAKQMFEYGFTAGQDYAESLLANLGEQTRGGHNRRDWVATLDMAKEISMIQRTDKGKQARQYFIDVEKRAPRSLTPDEIVAQALQITSARVRELETKVEQDAPKVGYVDTFVADNDALLFRTVASNLGIGEQALRWGLAYAGWIYHDQQRRRNSKGEVVTEHLWSEYAHKKPYFRRILNHQAPLFKDNTMYQLKITPPGAAAIAAWVEHQIAEHGSFTAALPALEARYTEKKAA